MDEQNKNGFTDVNYIEGDKTDNRNESYSKEKIINGKPLFYTTTQVASLVEVEASTIRFWSKRFANLLDVQISNKNKQYKESDIEKLKFIKKLTKEDGLTLQQVEEYCAAKGFNINDIESSILDTSNPLAIQTFIAALTTEMDKKQNVFGENLLKQIDNKMEILDYKLKQYLIIQAEENIRSNEKLQESLVTTVDEVVSEKLEENSKEISSKLNENSKELKQHIDESTEKSTQMQQENKKLLEEVAITMNDMKETNNKLKELLEDPEATKKIKKGNDSWISKLAKKFK